MLQHLQSKSVWIIDGGGGYASGPPIDQILWVCWTTQPLDSCSGVADNTAHNPTPHNWPFNYSGGCGKCTSYSVLYLCLSLCFAVGSPTESVFFFFSLKWCCSFYCVLWYLNSQFNYFSLLLFIRNILALLQKCISYTIHLFHYCKM